MKIREWTNPDPVTVDPNTTVADARQPLEERGVRHLPVVDGNRLIGIISDRDVGVGHAALRNAVRRREVDALLDDDRPVEAVMSSQPHVINADASISEAARLLVSLSGRTIV